MFGGWHELQTRQHTKNISWIRLDNMVQELRQTLARSKRRAAGRKGVNMSELSEKFVAALLQENDELQKIVGGYARRLSYLEAVISERGEAEREAESVEIKKHRALSIADLEMQAEQHRRTVIWHDRTFWRSAFCAFTTGQLADGQSYDLRDLAKAASEFASHALEAEAKRFPQ